jgi:hypothetical protein
MQAPKELHPYAYWPNTQGMSLCKYPPAKPGALVHEPPEAVDGVADATPDILDA